MLSTQKPHTDAVGDFAKFAERYPEVLAHKVPDVQEADLSAQGVGTMYHRVVGPPGSRERVITLCSLLKAAGHDVCWVKLNR